MSDKERLTDEELRRWEVGLEMSKPQHAGYDFVQIHRDQFTAMLQELQERRAAEVEAIAKATAEALERHARNELNEACRIILSDGTGTLGGKTTFGDLKPGEYCTVVVRCLKSAERERYGLAEVEDVGRVEAVEYLLEVMNDVEVEKI